MDQIVFMDGVAGKVAAHVHKGRQGARGDPFNPLHGGGGRVGPERVESGMSRLGLGKMVDHIQLVLVGLWVSVRWVICGKVILQGIDDDNNGLTEPAWGPA